ncbi:MAG: RNA-binding transcriptional accessory protein [Bacteroidales bacterium]|nr:RNA-binding transcriptional accessory protein [Bacteroidales bacterium]
MHEIIAQQVNIAPKQVANTIKLLEDGATIPFLARYRKEATGNLDEVEISSIRDALTRLKALIHRKEFIINIIRESGQLTPELLDELNNCYDETTLEDIYLPFKPKRNTKAEKARSMGLEYLAASIMAQNTHRTEQVALNYVGKDKAASVTEAIEYAGYIVAEWISESIPVRNRLRNYFNRKSIIHSSLAKNATDSEGVYRNYHDFSEPVFKTTSHRLLALFRGENEGILRIKIQPDLNEALEIIEKIVVKKDSANPELVRNIIKDSYKRLLAPSLETELRTNLKSEADKTAIDVFGKNLEQLLMMPPMPQKRILAIDPGFRTGCKVVCLDENGQLLHNETIYPHPPQKETALAMKKLNSLVQQFNIDVIAIGNGTAGRETEHFLSKIRFAKPLTAVMVNENGASIYSASAAARREFPQYDITVRGAVSIGRRLADPLAELVKIDPKAIGVGQYQYDVDQKELKQRLDDVVMSCVNRVGVDLNTASAELLQYVSGIGETVSRNIVEFRNQNGSFLSREQLLQVPKLGPKAYEQAAGFIRLRNSVNPLDGTAVHPESYFLVEKIAKEAKLSVADLIRNEDVLNSLKPEKYITEKIGLQTIIDIIEELKKPNRDPRKRLRQMEFSKEIHRVEDLKEGMIVNGVVTNITGFGAFVDLGVHQDGLIHISNMSDKFVSDPYKIVSINDFLEVEIVSLDISAKRINLKLIRKI